MTAYYPPANHSAQWFGGGSPITPDKVVIHCTEGVGWNGYNGGGYAPHLTARLDYTTMRLTWRQHISLDRNARALRNEPGGVQTNLDGCIQVEIVGTCDRKSGLTTLEMWDLPDTVRDDLAKFLAWCHKEYGIPLKAPDKWPRYPSSPSLDRAARMTYTEWRAFKGVCGHLHVPENTHLDPGDFPITDILRRASVVLSSEDKEWLKDNLGPAKIWGWDGIEAPAREEDQENKTWKPESFLRVSLNAIDSMARNAEDTLKEVLAIREEIKALTANTSINVDELTREVDDFACRLKALRRRMP